MYTLLLPHFNHTSIISADFHQITNHKTLFNASPDVPCGRTDRYNEANSRFSQFCVRA